MGKEDEKQKKESNIVKMLFEIIKYFLPAGVLVSCVPLIYNYYFASPKIEYVYGEEKDTFSVQTDFRGVSMRIYPQMLICYGEYVILTTHLDGYYEKEFVRFEDRVGYAVKSKQKYSNKLTQYIRDAILEKMKELYSEDEVRKIDEGLNVFISLIGGVQYKNLLGDDIEKYCIIEQNGIVMDYGKDAEEIKSRLYENEIMLSDNLNMIEVDGKINQIVDVVTKEVGRLYENDRVGNN